MISVDEALARVLALAAPLPAEEIALSEAAGRVLAAPVVARRDQPPFAASAMDGYAIGDTSAGPGARFRVIGEAGAGHGFPGPVGPGEAVRIFTGAPLPEGTNRVVIQEDTSRSEDIVTLGDSLDGGLNVRPAAADFSVGDRLDAPRRLRPADLALIAAMNAPRVTVSRRPVVALIATGDELVMPGETPGPDQIIASNTFALKAMAESVGAEARLLPIARDTEAELRLTLDLAADADLIVTIGGASVGDHDLVGKVAGDMGLDRAFYKVAMRPGKPLMAGTLHGTPMLGLPGNPVSSIVCGHLFMLPALRAMQGLTEVSPRPLPAILGADVGPTGPRKHYMRARLAPGETLPRITPFDSQDSALLTILTEAEALLIRPVGDGPRKAGETVHYLPL
ncbi:molybdopterin molybdotransferase MoeA [Acidimangrovimonas sediminis]|uniref:molybdopterin molybdotransferase MoeA n=1 Tax=Acidimangrovimonas sediminis TaxID=2056283 RepID=UPI000C80D7AA|nr:gephyrin-like molybdotransferase Glp [Acidimangrovimonas sediminis]